MDGRQSFLFKIAELNQQALTLLNLFFSREIASNCGCQELLIGFLGNEIFDRLFLRCSKSAKARYLFEFRKERRINFESTDVSILSIEVFLNESIPIGNEDSLFENILKLSGSYRDLLRHIQLEFLSEDGLSLLSEYFDIPPESGSEFSVEQITHLPPPPPVFDSRIISDIPEILTEFLEQKFSIL
jgi:hypothetical protein